MRDGMTEGDVVYSRNGSEHALVEAEQNIRELRRADGGLGDDILETKVRHVAKEDGAGVREGQGVTPEEPLEAHHSNTYHRYQN